MLTERLLVRPAAFLVAGRLCNAQPFGAEVEATCLAGIAAITEGGGLHAPTVEILLGDNARTRAPLEVAAVESLVAAHGVSPPPQTGPPPEVRTQSNPHRNLSSRDDD